MGHSIPDAFSVVVHSPVGPVIYTGDWKFAGMPDSSVYAATKAGLSDIRAELRAMRSDTAAGFEALREEMQSGTAALRAEMLAARKLEIGSEIRSVQAAKTPLERPISCMLVTLDP